MIISKKEFKWLQNGQDLLLDEINKRDEHIKNLEEIISCIVNTTFENNTVFDTVVFQKKNMPPLIYKNGKQLNTENDDNVEIYFKKKNGNGWRTQVETRV